MALSLEAIEKQLDDLLAQAAQALSGAQEASVLESLRVEFLGRKGRLASLFATLQDPTLPSPEKAQLGKKLNAVKERLEALLGEREGAVRAEETGDPLRPACTSARGEANAGRL